MKKSKSKTELAEDNTQVPICGKWTKDDHHK